MVASAVLELYTDSTLHELVARAARAYLMVIAHNPAAVEAALHAV
jgi:hypothetical protein